MSISTELIGKTPEQAARLKAQRLSEFIQGNLPYTYLFIGSEGSTYSITIRSAAYDTARGVLSLDLSAVKNSSAISLNLPYEYYNPPIMVPASSTNAGKESPLEAIKASVGLTVARQGRVQ